MRRFLTIGMVVTLLFLLFEGALIYASAHPASSPLSSPDADSKTATAAARAGSEMTTATRAAIFVSRVIARTNAYRVANGCAPLTISTILMGTAQAHSQEMALRDYVAHSSADGTSPWDRISAAGYSYQLVAENIAWGATSPEQVVDAWFFELPPNDAHRKNILNCGLREIGVGYYYLANDPGTITAHTYWTQDFGTPARETAGRE